MPWQTYPGSYRVFLTIKSADGEPIEGLRVNYPGWHHLQASYPRSQLDALAFGQMTFTNANGLAVLYLRQSTRYAGGIRPTDPWFDNWQDVNAPNWPHRWVADGYGENGARKEAPFHPKPTSPFEADDPNWPWFSVVDLDAGIQISYGDEFSTQFWFLNVRVPDEFTVGGQLLHQGDTSIVHLFHAEPIPEDDLPVANVTIHDDGQELPVGTREDYEAKVSAELGGPNWWQAEPFAATSETLWFPTEAELPTMHPGLAVGGVDVRAGMSAELRGLYAKIKRSEVTTEGASTGGQVQAVMENQKRIAQVLASLHQAQADEAATLMCMQVALQQRLEMLFQMVNLLGVALLDEGWHDQINIHRERGA